MRIYIIIKIIISFMILAIIIYLVNPKKILESLSTMNLLYLIPAIIFYLLTFVIGAWNINILLKAIKKKIKPIKLLKYTIISWSFGLISPGKIGDFSIVYFLKKEKVKIGTGFAISLIDKAITLFVLLLFALVTTLVILSKKEFFIILIILIMAIMAGLMLLTKKVRNIIKKRILRKYAKKFKGFSKTINFIGKNNKKALLKNFLVTILKWIIGSIVVLVIFMGLSYAPNLVLITLISASLTIFNLIPITFHGIGIKEGVGIYLYGLIDIPGTVVVTVYIILNILTYFFAAVSIYFTTEELKKLRGEK